MGATIIAGNFEDNARATEAVKAVAAPPRRAGMVVAVNASAQAPEKLAIAVLREHGARDIERAKGTWRQGKWQDFDPLSPPKFVE